jgi:hypothetical protein
MKTTYAILFAVMLIGLCSSCDKDTDDPTVSITSPGDNDTLKSGDELHIEMTFADNEALSWYRVHLGDHQGGSQPEFLIDYEDNDVDGNTFHLHEHATVPDSVQPAYYLHIEAKDEAGNDLETRLRLNIKPN